MAGFTVGWVVHTGIEVYVVIKAEIDVYVDSICWQIQRKTER